MGKKIVYVFSAVLLLSIGGFLCYYYFIKNKHEEVHGDRPVQTQSFYSGGELLRITNRTYCDTVHIYSADELIDQIKSTGRLDILSPIDFVYLDSLHLKNMVDAEFRHGFWRKDHDNPKIVVYEIPELTLELAEVFRDNDASKRLYNYYLRIPKMIKSDTVYNVYKDLDGFLKVLVMYKHPNFIEKLKRDYWEWMRLAEKAPPKSYPPAPKRNQDGSYSDSISWYKRVKLAKQAKFKPDYLYVDCYYMALQVAGALYYMKVKGFDDALMEQLIAKQTYTYAKKYSFPESIGFMPRRPRRKTIDNATLISDFKTDYKKVEKLIQDNFENSSDSKLCAIVEKGSKAWLHFVRKNGSDNYIMYLNKNNNTVVVEMASSIMSDSF